MYGEDAPEGVTVADPFVPLKQETFMAVVLRDGAGLMETVPVAVEVFPALSLTVTV